MVLPYWEYYNCVMPSFDGEQERDRKLMIEKEGGLYVYGNHLICFLGDNELAF